ncbi:MAG TPA: dTDP-4-dehydrorhamnose 3,5-epimerase [Blastocatellia bacterium]|nr:dTDP-4-dehydrorhamnose 3,5-epimerase [Blastocatellia bacterium]
MKRTETSLPAVCLIEPQILRDERGFFFESYNKAKFAAIGVDDVFVQDNHSKSVRGTLRGLHYQLKYPQSKLCRVVQGRVLDVVVDIRAGSPTFGRYATAELSDENRSEIYIPRGFAHGFAVLSDSAEFLYKCSEFYHPEDERGVAWNDPEIGIDWGIIDPIVSAKDSRHRRLSSIPPEELPRYT